MKVQDQNQIKPEPQSCQTSVMVSYSEYLKALETIDNYFKNRQEPNFIGCFKDGLSNEIHFALRMGISSLSKEYGFENTKKRVGGFPLAFIEYLTEGVMHGLNEKYHDNEGKVSTMDAYFKQRRHFL
jgi:hypothetical protein